MRFPAWVLLGIGAAISGCGSRPPDPVSHGPLDDDTLLVLNAGDASISVIRVRTNRELGVIRISGIEALRSFALSRDGERLAVATATRAPGAESTGATLLTLDARTGAPLGHAELDRDVNDLSVARSGELWAAGAGIPGEVIVLDGALQVEKRIAVGADPTMIGFAGEMSFVLNRGSSDLSVLATSSKEVLKTIPLGGRVTRAWMSPTGRLYLGDAEAGTLLALETARLTVTRTYTLGFAAGGVADAGSELWVTDPAGGRVVWFAGESAEPAGAIPVGPGAAAVALTLDGVAAFVANESSGTVSVINVARHEVVDEIAVGSRPRALLVRAR